MSDALDKVEENIFKLTSDELKNNMELPNDQVYKGYGCNGGNVSPALFWQNAPSSTKSFAIIIGNDPRQGSNQNSVK